MDKTETVLHKHKKHSFHFLGFTIYDFMHITFALFFIVYSLVIQEEGFVLEIAEESATLVLAVILIGFLDVLKRKEADNIELRNYFTFAWLMASAAQLIPLMIKTTEAFSEKSPAVDDVILIVGLVFSVVAFIAFFLCIIQAKHGAKWRVSMLVAMVLFLLVVPFVIAHLFLSSAVTWVTWLRLLKEFAPLFPLSFGLSAFFKDTDSIEMVA